MKLKDDAHTFKGKSKSYFTLKYNSNHTLIAQQKWLKSTLILSEMIFLCSTSGNNGNTSLISFIGVTLGY